MTAVTIPAIRNDPPFANAGHGPVILSGPACAHTMQHMDTRPPGKSKGRELAERLAEAGAGSVPMVGAALAVALVTALNWKLNQRRDDWLEDLAEAIEELGERVDRFDVETLVADPLFVDAVVSAVRTVEHTYQEAKLTALRNAVLNSVDPHAPDADTQAIFLSLVDRFTATHLRLLTMLNDPPRWFAVHDLTVPPGAIAGAMAEIVEAGLPELKGRPEFYGLVAADLNASGLLAVELSALLGTTALMRPITNGIGRQFVEFIRPPGV